MNLPNDENGDVLRRMYAGGDLLTKPRIIDFCFVFPERTDAISFASNIREKEFEICISYYETENKWQTIVKKFMIPDHVEISSTEAELTQRAEKYKGNAAGWGCMRIIEAKC